MARVRPARLEEIPYLEQRLKDSPHEHIDIRQSICHVAVDDDDVIIGLLPISLVWQAEPLYIFPECTNKITRSKACYGLWRAMESWIQSPANLCGVRKYFCISRSRAFKGWTERVGLHRIYKGAAHYIKYL